MAFSVRQSSSYAAVLRLFHSEIHGPRQENLTSAVSPEIFAPTKSNSIRHIVVYLSGAVHSHCRQRRGRHDTIRPGTSCCAFRRGVSEKLNAAGYQFQFPDLARDSVTPFSRDLNLSVSYTRFVKFDTTELDRRVKEADRARLRLRRATAELLALKQQLLEQHEKSKEHHDQSGGPRRGSAGGGSGA